MARRRNWVNYGQTYLSQQNMKKAWKRHNFNEMHQFISSIKARRHLTCSHVSQCDTMLQWTHSVDWLPCRFLHNYVYSYCVFTTLQKENLSPEKIIRSIKCFYCTSQYQIFIDCEAGEIMYLVASVRPSVCPFVSRLCRVRERTIGVITSLRWSSVCL